MNHRAILAEAVEKHITRAKEGQSFTMASGKLSNYYIDIRAAVLSDGAAMAAAIHELYGLLPPDVTGIGGVSTAGLLFSGALLAHAALNDPPGGERRYGFYTRERPKTHGTGKQFEGYAYGTACLIEDTITTGKSVLEHSAIALTGGANVRYVLAVFERNDGARKRLRDAGIELRSVFKGSDFGL